MPISPIAVSALSNDMTDVASGATVRSRADNTLAEEILLCIKS